MLIYLDILINFKDVGDVSKEQTIRVLTRVRKEKMASGKYFPTCEEQITDFKCFLVAVTLHSK